MQPTAPRSPAHLDQLPLDAAGGLTAADGVSGLTADTAFGLTAGGAAGAGRESGSAAQDAEPADAVLTAPSVDPAAGKGKDEKSPREELLLKGSVLRITFRNDETGFGVLRLDPENVPRDQLPGSGGGWGGSGFGEAAANRQVAVVGVIPADIGAGAHIVARGEWQTHPKFGRQFRAWSMTETAPTGKEAIIRYLGSGAIKGFGPVLAQRIVDHFGEDALKVLDTDPERLTEVPGIGEKKYLELRAAWEQKRNLREVLLFFQGHNVPLGLAQRIYNTYGDRAIEIVRRNPYVLARDVWGIGFQTADRIAVALDVALDSTERIVAALQHTLKRGADDGHCFLPADLLLSRTASLLQLDDEEVIARGLAHAVEEGEVIDRAGAYYQPALFEAEGRLSALLAARLRRSGTPAHPIDEQLVERTISEPRLGGTGVPTIVLSEQQQEAVRLSASRNLVVITGGPGCGKTTVVRTIASLFRRKGIAVQLAAPTGRAAQRLAEVCEMKASTIHRMLKFDPVRRTFLHDENTLLPVEALIVDESSMIDVPLAAALLAAVPPEVRLIIVGDADQLPSVGPGLFLADLLALPEVPRVRLSTLFRRADESLITGVAHQINAGIVPEIPQPDGQTKADAYFLPAREPGEAAALVERLVVDQIPKRFGLRGSQIMVLSPMNQGELGVIALNERLQRQLVPSGEGLPHVKVGNLELRLGDRICQRVNNYQLGQSGVFNGDQGEIVGIDGEQKSVQVRLWDGREVTYPSETLWQLDLGYALTIHRSQGSEVPVVILVLHESHTILLERQLIYTAVTRAKKLLIIVGSRRALMVATKRSRSRRRFTALGERTMEELVGASYDRAARGASHRSPASNEIEAVLGDPGGFSYEPELQDDGDDDTFLDEVNGRRIGETDEPI